MRSLMIKLEIFENVIKLHRKIEFNSSIVTLIGAIGKKVSSIMT